MSNELNMEMVVHTPLAVKLTKPIVDWSKRYPKNEDTVLLAKSLYDYWNQEYPNNPINTAPQHIKDFQPKNIINEIFNILRKENSLLLSGTGTGKTYMLLAALDIVIYFGYTEYALAKRGSKLLTPFPYLYLVNANALDQIQSVINQFENCRGKVYVINYEQLRTKASLGAILIKQIDVEKERNKKDKNKEYDKEIDILNKFIDEEDDDLILRSWHPDLRPICVIKDEVQKLKNNGAIQTKSMQAFSVLTEGDEYTLELNASATPLVKLIESRTLSLSCRPPHELYIDSPRVNIDTWEDFIQYDVCAKGSKPTDYSPASMEKFRNHLGFYDNIIHVNDVKFKHKSMNKHILINFKTKEWENYYTDAFIKYCLKLAEIGKDTPGGIFEAWAAQTAFRKAAEYSRYEIIAEIAAQKEKDGKNVICGFVYVNTLEATCRELIDKHGYKESDIAIIRGGQTRSNRWGNINNFQDEKAHIVLVMQQAGGTALSLHHYQPRNKRPRFVLCSATWSIIDQLQFIGRAHRINSASTTHQWILWYAGTVEEEVYNRLQSKALSLREMMRRKEDWSSLFTSPDLRQKINTRTDDHLNIDTDSDIDDEDEQDVWNVDAELVSANIEQE